MTPTETNSSEHEEIRNRLTKIETKLDIVLEQYEKRLTKVEDTVGKQNFVSAVMSAVGISIVFIAKYLFNAKSGGA